jgi:hypothetical protein
MSTPRRTGAVLGLLLPIALPVPAAAPGALAADSTPKVVQSNWYWYHQAYAADGTGLETAPEPSGVPKGDLSVAYTGGTTSDSTQPSKETYLAFDLSGIDPTASITSFTFTLTLDGAAQLKTAAPALIACAPVRTWSNGEGTSWFDKPTDDCSTAIAAEGKPDATAGTYTFAVPSMAQHWLDVNTGVAIRPALDTKAPFQLNFTGPATVKAKVEYLPPVSTTYAPPPAAVTPPVASVSAPTGPVGGVGTTPSLGAPTTTAPSVAAPASPPPQVAPQQPVAAIRHFAPAGSMPSTSFWFVTAALLGLLLCVSRVLGSTTAPAVQTTTNTRAHTSRLDHVLRARRTSFTLEPR